MWNPRWEKTKQDFIDWWNHKGILIGMWSGIAAGRNVHSLTFKPREPKDLFEYYSNAMLRAEWNHYILSRSEYPFNTLPVADTDIGPGSLALFLGCEPKFTNETVWFDSCISERSDKKLFFDPQNRWWNITKETLKECRRLSHDNYLVGCPDLIENLDILALLSGPESLMMNMIDRPSWVKEKLYEINEVWFQAYDQLYDIIKLEDQSSCFGPFKIWGPGKTVKVQCDESAMISAKMFREFVVPPLTAQCKKLDNVLYHLDGTDAVKHLDAILEIDSIKAIEWTPESGIERGGNKRWFEMYKRILDAGKSLQIVEVKHDQILPILDVLGDNGIYFLCEFNSLEEAEKLYSQLYW